MLGARSIHRFTRRIHKLHMLDIQHVLPALEGQGTRSQRPEEDAHQLLPVGAVHPDGPGHHVLLAVDRVAQLQCQDGLRHRHHRQVRQQSGAPEPRVEGEVAAVLGQAHGQGARGAA